MAEVFYKDFFKDSLLTCKAGWKLLTQLTFTITDSQAK